LLHRLSRDGEATRRTPFDCKAAPPAHTCPGTAPGPAVGRDVALSVNTTAHGVHRPEG